MAKFVHHNLNHQAVQSVFLLGYMGCGKSTIGSALAASLDCTFLDLDQYIEAKENTSVAQLFEKKGEMYFRKVERESLLELLDEKASRIIALGGGTPCYYDNIKAIAATAHASFYLKASIPTLAARLWNEKAQRPILQQIESQPALSEFIGKHLFERNFFYHQAKKTVIIDGKSIETIVAEIKRDLT